ncbi:PpiC-type peptidyl-prolyl cis-trans isomerase [Flavobacteriaceae bacterium 3519-10]|nr:PpiC-type peptidyl-prolyl cis-trans isomerase [Flavobacteriaceae bacterium 3519-10]
MKKLFVLTVLLSLSITLQAQYFIIGKDSISLADFKREYQYGLQNNGITKTLQSTEDFILLQQFAAEKKADTAAAFREKMMVREGELREQFFYPKHIIDPLLEAYMKDNLTEKEVQIFLVPKTEGDANNYKQIYADVVAGKLKMEDALTKYTKNSPNPVHIKPGSADNALYDALKVLPNNTFTNLMDLPGYIAFAKVLNSRPSLGYMIFGTISYPKDENSEATKTKIYTDLKAGKTFQQVAKLYGANDHEKDNGGVVMGSPTLPAEVYAAFKGQKSGYYTPEPILFGDKYFVFNIYNVEPYALNDKNRDFFLKDMNASLYGEKLQDKMIAFLKSDPSYKEFPEFQQMKKSYQTLATAKDNTPLYAYKNRKVTVGDIKTLIGDKKSDAEKLTPALWAEALGSVNSGHLLSYYSEDFAQQKDIKKELTEFRKGLFSDYVFSKYINEEITKHPEWLTDYYNKNKSKYMWGNRADGRVAIIADDNLTKEIVKDIKNPKNWEALTAKYYGKLNDKKQIIVHFEKGEMSEDADVFTKYKVPFKTGVHQTKMEQRTLVIAIEKILPPMQMTQEEAAELLKDAVTEEKLREIIAQQKAKTQITVQPAFSADLDKNFKK